MKPSFTTRQTLLPLMLGGGLLLAACGGGGGGGGSGGTASGLSGTAAVGAPLVSATVSLKCNGQEASATTNAQGKWSAGIRESALPCAIEVSGGTVNGAAFTGRFYSYAQSLGTVNVTPLTSLAVARAVQSAHGQSTAGYWFSHVTIGGSAPAGSVCVFTDTSSVSGQNITLNTCMVDVPQSECKGPSDITNPNGGPTVTRSYSYKACPEGAVVVDGGTGGDLEDSYAPAALAAAVADARAALLTALANAGYTVPEGLDPFTTAFDAVSGNSYDDLLEALREALGGDPDYATLESDFASNGETLPEAPEPTGPGGTDDTAPATVNSALVKSHTLTFRKGGGSGCGSLCTHTEGQQVAVVVGSDNSLTIAGKKLTAPFNRKFGGSPHLPEIIWKDGDIEYALSDNQLGTFNEINVGKAKAGGGIPDFIGQLRAPVVADDPAAKLKPLAGSYAPRYVLKSGNSYTLPSKPAADDPVTATISEAGVVTVGGETFDPADTAVRFTDLNRPNLSEPYYSLSRKDSDTVSVSVDMYLVDDRIVAWKVARTESGNGTASVSHVMLEERPLPAAQSTLINAFKDMGKLTLTAVGADSQYAKCDPLWLLFGGDGSYSNAWHYKLEKAPASGTGQGSWLDREQFERKSARYSTVDGNETLAFPRKHLVKRADGKVDLLERRWTGSSYAVITIASNDPARITTAGCDTP